MKPREEYEKLCDKTFTLAGDAQATRMQIDILLDIRELLAWLRDQEMLKQIKEEREKISQLRVRSVVYRED